jgi:excisionase family DNA binding protein
MAQAFLALLWAFSQNRAAHVPQEEPQEVYGAVKGDAIKNELDLSEETVLRWMRRKELTAYRLGKTYRMSKEDYQEFLDQRYTGKPDEEEKQ